MLSAMPPRAPPTPQAVIAALRKVAANPAQRRQSPQKTFSFAIDQLLEINKKEGPLKDRIDREKSASPAIPSGAIPPLPSPAKPFQRHHLRRQARQGRRGHEPPVRQPNAKQFEPIHHPVLTMTAPWMSPRSAAAEAPMSRLKGLQQLTGCQRYLLVFEGRITLVQRPLRQRRPRQAPETPATAPRTPSSRRS